MASQYPPPSLASTIATGSPAPREADQEKALFALAKPIAMVRDGAEIETQEIWMRALRAADLALVDTYRGQPIALAQNMIATLCDLTIEQVQLLSVEDFTVLAGEVIWLVKQVLLDLGLSPPAILEAPREADQE